ncbi:MULTISPECIES: RsmD family RNA methyltransferase [Campylobacter]|uniref:RsmD family RNA methyltransferase n=1 Tax=Campylobacter TaxID=194 RepID=UPI001D66F85E|nr:23S rRNA (adenine(2030)-N(6))-methyltransferase RlmJ [Campylobacter sp. RM10538]MBZ7941300.1 23S rRNA (adenine(2030)-N(6))-methyltransferase RlmJ [Campylobacter sp. W0047]MBZ7944084.1 23S rRNA (adenine(2030)-N(6))-methyltransferase RlmJ [Campylobacter sp. RM13744]MBZ7947271.1 23S rRNA (adenine(2030)-N(6))-methyltransferase RlmJ [Campylobacter sp. RM10536]MBZ7953166.1 23S rRNA (adenine(2030)-N(6))-methyltransferase RlmJ [Campylobacter sp. RM9939]MBZ7957554.1 23S rRNA (adenine(2030)-N(6))-met
MSEDFIHVKDFLKEYQKISNLKNKTNKTTKIYTFIESGQYKGKKLLLPSLEKTRSTKSIVKACVFNVIRQNLRNKIFIEAFGGSALMAAEALSNFALKSYAIELDKNAYKIAVQNSKIDQNLNVVQGDTFEILPQLIEKLTQENIPIFLYLDPPFDIRKGFEKIYENIENLLKNLNRKNIEKIIFEHHSKIELPQNIEEFQKNKSKKFGLTSLSFYENTPQN